MKRPLFLFAITVGLAAYQATPAQAQFFTFGLRLSGEAAWTSPYCYRNDFCPYYPPPTVWPGTGGGFGSAYPGYGYGYEGGGFSVGGSVTGGFAPVAGPYPGFGFGGGMTIQPPTYWHY